MTDRRDEFYVGYLPVGARQRVVLRCLVPAIGFALLAVASLLAMSTNPAGIGVWASDTVSFEGVLRVDPYAEVITADGRAMLIVDAGKGGIRDGIGAHEGELVRVEGFPISRVGHSVLELLPGEAGLTPLGPLMGGAALDRPSGDAVIVRGEVLPAPPPIYDELVRVAQTIQKFEGVELSTLQFGATGRSNQLRVDVEDRRLQLNFEQELKESGTTIDWSRTASGGNRSLTLNGVWKLGGS